MTNEEIMIEDSTYECIVWSCPHCGCQVIVDIDSMPMILDGKAKAVVEPNYCPECGKVAGNEQATVKD